LGNNGILNPSVMWGWFVGNDIGLNLLKTAFKWHLACPWCLHLNGGKCVLWLFYLTFRPFLDIQLVFFGLRMTT
jgi:hypothetical protein